MKTNKIEPQTLQEVEVRTGQAACWLGGSDSGWGAG